VSAPRRRRLRRRLHRYVKPDLLVIDEIGFLSYTDCSADLLVMPAESVGIFRRQLHALPDRR
jgi:DNA replication protein DnaC